MNNMILLSLIIIIIILSLIIIINILSLIVIIVIVLSLINIVILRIIQWILGNLHIIIRGNFQLGNRRKGKWDCICS